MCTCITDIQFKGNNVQGKIRSDSLQRIDFGSNFGEVLYKCPVCGQLWEENLSKATNKDWPPILVKISKKDALVKYEDYSAN